MNNILYQLGLPIDVLKHIYESYNFQNDDEIVKYFGKLDPYFLNHPMLKTKQAISLKGANYQQFGTYRGRSRKILDEYGEYSTVFHDSSQFILYFSIQDENIRKLIDIHFV